MDEWLVRFADALDERAPTPEESRALLGLARSVAHGVERRLAPLSTFVLGLHVARAVAEGGSREEAVDRAIAAARALLPPDGG